MSQTFEYFLNYNGSLAELADMVRAAVGVHLSPCSDTSDDLCGQLLGMDFFLGTHDYEDDQGIPFGDYRYELGLKTFLPDGDLRSLQVAVMVAMPYLLYHRHGLTGMLVFDLQYLIASYEARVGADGKAALFDTVSATFVRLPGHWKAVSSRIPGRAFTTEAELEIDSYLRSTGHIVHDDT
jgi:hypothetical protein